MPEVEEEQTPAELFRAAMIRRHQETAKVMGVPPFRIGFRNGIGPIADIQSALDQVERAEDRLTCAEIDAGACGTQWDYRNKRTAEEAAWEARTEAENALADLLYQAYFDGVRAGREVGITAGRKAALEEVRKGLDALRARLGGEG